MSLNRFFNSQSFHIPSSKVSVIFKIIDNLMTAEPDQIISNSKVIYNSEDKSKNIIITLSRIIMVITVIAGILFFVLNPI